MSGSIPAGSYDHIDKQFPFSIEIPMDDLVRKIEKMNHGVHRLLTSIVKVRREQHGTIDELATEIEKLLNKGLSL